MAAGSEVEYLMSRIIRLKGVKYVNLRMTSLAPHKKRWRVRIFGDRKAEDTFGQKPEIALAEMRSKLTNKKFTA
jgi:hypothetical protein